MEIHEDGDTLGPEVFSLSEAPKAQTSGEIKPSRVLSRFLTFGFASPLVRTFGASESEKTSEPRVRWWWPMLVELTRNLLLTVQHGGNVQ